MPSALPATPPPTTPHADESSHRRLDIQGLRALAVLVVVAFHAGLPVPGGFVGVDIFFVISGFVITGLLHREWLATGRIRFGEFSRRRFKRLTPALALMVSVTVVVGTFVVSPLGTQQTLVNTALGAMLLVANFVIARTTNGYFDAPASTNALLNTWSLSVEEQFYLVFPALIAVGWLVARRHRRVGFAPAGVVAAIAAVSFALCLLFAYGPDLRGGATVLGFFSPFTRAWEFAAGALLALMFTKRSGVSSGTARTLGAVGALAVVVSLWLISDESTFPGLWTLLPVAGTLLLLAAGTRANPISTALSARPMVRVGDWSYSIYLWHWPLIVFAGVLWDGTGALIAAAAVSFVPALASYRWVEQPVRRMRVTSRRRTASLVAAVMAPPIVLALGMAVIAHHSYWNARIQEFQAATLNFHAAHNTGCDLGVAQQYRPPGECVWNATATGKPIYLLGDSNADHFSEGIVLAAEKLNRPVIINTASCPMIDVWMHDTTRPQRMNDQCRSYVSDTLDYMVHSEPGTVVLASADSYWISPATWVGLDEATATNDTEAKAAILETGLTSTVQQLQADGNDVVLVQSTPFFSQDRWDPPQCSWWSIALSGCVAAMTTAEAEVVQSHAREAVAAAAEATGSTLVDPWIPLCPDGVCSIEGPGFIRYHDGAHLSVRQSEALAPFFETYLEGHMT